MAQAGSFLLGIDVGTSATKALVCDGEGRVAATASAAHPEPTGEHPGWSEQRPADWWAATRKAVSEVMAEAGVDAPGVGGVGLSGQMHGSVFLDASGEPLRPAILWNDQRTAAQCRQIEQAMGGREALIQQVGNPALTGFTAPKILWLQQYEPTVYQRTAQILLPKDYIRYRMTGAFATDVGDASGTLLLDVEGRRWNREVLEKLGIEPGLLPPVYESHQVTAPLSEDGAAALGLSAGIPVVGGSGDQPAGAVGSGIVSPGIVSATLGTSGVVFAHADRPQYDPRGRVHTMCSAAGKWCVFGCMLAAGGSLQWVRQHLGRAEVEEAKRRGVDPYELLIEQAAQARPGCDGLFFLPYLTGERCPHPDPDARGGWIGLTARHDRAALIRSVLEGITFGMGDIVQIMREMDIRIETVRLAGGGARSRFWRQLQADVYGHRVATINAAEGPAYGAAILAGVGAGVWDSVETACRTIIEETERLEPDASQHEGYAPYHRQYQRLYAALAPEFEAISALR